MFTRCPQLVCVAVKRARLKFSSKIEYSWTYLSLENDLQQVVPLKEAEYYTAIFTLQCLAKMFVF